MNTKIIEGAKQAIKSGHGDFYCMNGLTWSDLLEGYNAGNRLIDYQEAEVLAKLSLLDIN